MCWTLNCPVILHLLFEQLVATTSAACLCARRIIDVNGVAFDIPHQNIVAAGSPVAFAHARNDQITSVNGGFCLSVILALAITVNVAPVQSGDLEAISSASRLKVSVIRSTVGGFVAMSQSPSTLTHRVNLGVSPCSQHHCHRGRTTTGRSDGCLLSLGRVIFVTPLRICLHVINRLSHVNHSPFRNK